MEGLHHRRRLAFDLAVNYGAGPKAVPSADISNETILDLAVASYFSSNVSVLLGNPDCTFQPALTSATGSNPLALAFSDFDGNDILDLATANVYGNSGDASVLLGIERRQRHWHLRGPYEHGHRL